MQDFRLIEMLLNKKEMEKQEIADKLEFLKSTENTEKFQMIYSQENQKIELIEKGQTLNDNEIVVTVENLPNLNHSI